MSDQYHRRAVITGLGVVAPNGNDVETFWSGIRDGVSSAGLVTRFDTSRLPNKVASEVKNFDFGLYADAKKARRFDLSIQYGIYAAAQAAEDAGIRGKSFDPDRIGVVEASSVSGMESTFKGQTAFEDKGYRSMSPFTLLNAYAGGGSGEIALELGIQGHALTYS